MHTRITLALIAGILLLIVWAIAWALGLVEGPDESWKVPG